jgi:hypothetical protein
MKKLLSTFLIFIFSACAIYPEIPQKYLEPSTPKSTSLTAPPTVPDAASQTVLPKKKIPQLNGAILLQFSEKEKEILASRVYEAIFQKPQIEPAVIQAYPDLRRYGNEVVLAMRVADGPLVRRKGSGENILGNVEQAARAMPPADPKTTAFWLQITPLEMLLWGEALHWTELRGGRYFLSVSSLDDKLVYARWLLHQKFLESYWLSFSSTFALLREGEQLSPFAWLNFIASTPSPAVPFEKTNQMLKKTLFSRVKDYGQDGSFVALRNGRMDIEGTAFLALLILTTENPEKDAFLFERFSRALLSLQREDGSLLMGLKDSAVIPKGDLRIPLILKTYHSLHQAGAVTALKAFKKSFSYYFPSNFDYPNALEQRLKWGRLLIGLMSDPEKDAYEKYLEGILDWFFQKIKVTGGPEGKDAGSFQEGKEKAGDALFMEIFELLAEGYRHFKIAKAEELKEKWSLNLFFAVRYFLNLQVEESDIRFRSFRPSYLGSFPLEGSASLFWEGQLWAERGLTETLRLWGSKEWSDLRERAEAQL